MHEEVRKLFEAIRSRGAIENIDQIEALLPADPTVLGALSSRCQSESRKAFRAGHHIEGRRLGILAEQLSRRAQSAPET